MTEPQPRATRAVSAEKFPYAVVLMNGEWWIIETSFSGQYLRKRAITHIPDTGQSAEQVLAAWEKEQE